MAVEIQLSVPSRRTALPGRDQELLVFSNFNRIHAVPPCTVTADEVTEGLHRLDAALTVADRHYVGSHA